MAAHADVEAVLKDIEQFLRRHNETGWASMVDSILNQHRSKLNCPDICDDARALFGGMGSFTDLWISRANGHSVDDEAVANATLDHLRERLWDLLRNQPSE